MKHSRKYSCHFSPCLLSTGWSKKTNTLCFVHLDFIEYWPIFKLISLSESKKTFVIILSLKIPPHLKYVATLLVKCQCLKSNNWKEDGFCNKHIKKINNRKQRVYSQLLSKVTVTSCSYTVVQMFNVSTLLLYDAVLKLFLQKSSCCQLLLLRHWYFTR